MPGPGRVGLIRRAASRGLRLFSSRARSFTPRRPSGANTSRVVRPRVSPYAHVARAPELHGINPTGFFKRRFDISYTVRTQHAFTQAKVVAVAYRSWLRDNNFPPVVVVDQDRSQSITARLDEIKDWSMRQQLVQNDLEALCEDLSETLKTHPGNKNVKVFVEGLQAEFDSFREHLPTMEQIRQRGDLAEVFAIDGRLIP